MRNPETVVCHEHPRHIELVWPDGTRRSFLYVWLRDNCPTGRHSSGQKSIETSSISRDISAETMSINELGVLEIKWAGEDHVSYFDVEVLRRKSEPEKNWTSIIPDGVTLWDASLNHETASVTYRDFVSDEATLYSFLTTFVHLGFGIIKDSPTERDVLSEVVNQFGYIRETNYGKTFSVRIKSDPKNLADTSMALSPHTDNPYRNPVPTLQLLHCLENSMQGGETILLDGFRLAEQLYNTSLVKFNLLSSVPVKFRYRTEHVWLEADTTLLGLDPRGYIKHIRLNNRSIRPFDARMRRLEEYYDAYFSLLELVNASRFQVQFKLEPGDIMVFDNERILHGRTAYSGAGNRHLVGCYADRDGLLSTWRILKRNYEEKLTNGYTLIKYKSL